MKKILITLLSMILMASFGSLVGGAIASDVSLPVNYQEKTYGVNEHLQTFGSLAWADELEDAPDLTSVIGDRGIRGYVYTNLMFGPLPSSPEEAVKNQTPAGEVHKVLTVYLSDGETVIDTFTILGAFSDSPEDLEKLMELQKTQKGDLEESVETK